MEIKLIHCKLAVCFFFFAFVLFQTRLHAAGNPALVNQQEVEPLGFDMQISEAGCLRLLEKIDIGEDLREKAILRVMSSESGLIGPVLRLCNAYYDDTKLLVRRLTQLFSTTVEKALKPSVDVDSSDEPFIKQRDNNKFTIKPAYWNDLGQAVFKLTPIDHSWVINTGNGNQAMANIGEYIDVNGDSLLDFVVGFFDPTDRYYRATFINNGEGEWVMVACESTFPASARFPPCP